MTNPGPHDQRSSSDLPRPPGGEGEINILRIVNVAVRHVWLIIGAGLVLAMIALGQGFATPLSYTADASFIPQGSRAPSSVSALAAQLGMGAAVSEGGQSPQFYVDLIKSREVLRGVVRSQVTIRTDTGVVTGDLVKVYGLKGKPAHLLEASAMRMVSGSVQASPSPKTGVITLRATTEYPDLSAQVVAKFLEQINKFNLQGRQSRASAERRFTEGRLREAEAALTTAENRLEEFQRTNRDFGSPTLMLQRDRLNRTVVARQEIFTALAQGAEQARIEEVRDTPAITIIEPPAVPIVPNPRGIGSRTVKSMIFGMLLGAMLAFLLDFFRRSGTRDAEALQELVTLSRDTLRNPLRRRSGPKAR